MLFYICDDADDFAVSAPDVHALTLRILARKELLGEALIYNCDGRCFAIVGLGKEPSLDQGNLGGAKIARGTNVSACKRSATRWSGLTHDSESRAAAVLAGQLIGSADGSDAGQRFDRLQDLAEEGSAPLGTDPRGKDVGLKRGRARILRLGQINAQRECVLRIESRTVLLEQKEASKHESCLDEKYQRKRGLGDDQQAAQPTVLRAGRVALA